MNLILEPIYNLFKNIWSYIQNKPRVSCEVTYWEYGMRWYPDYCLLYNEKERIEGITIELRLSLLFANDGPVNTSIKSVFIRVLQNNKSLGELYPEIKPKGNKPVQTLEIAARAVQKVDSVVFRGFLPNLSVLPKT